MKLKNIVAACAVAGAALGLAVPAHALLGLDLNSLNPSYTKTKNPIVLVHGLLGFDSIIGIDYFFGVKGALQAGGAKVYVVQLSPADSHEARGEDLLQQLKALKAAGKGTKFNIIGHSQGGLAARYVAAVSPDIVASVSQVQTPNQGSKVADHITNTAAADPESGQQLMDLATDLLKVINWASDNPNPNINVGINLFYLRTDVGANWSNARPAGKPTTECGTAPALAGNGVRYYSVGGTKVYTNLLDISDPILGLVSEPAYGKEVNDGLVGRCSSHWGEVLRDDYPWNHLDGINHVFGLVGLLAPDPLTFYRSQANRLKAAGL